MSLNSYRPPPLGLPKPEKEPMTCDEMRKAIVRASYDDPIIRAAMTHADATGMSGEDRYTLLAYHTLRRIQDLWIQNCRFMDCMPSPLLKDLHPSAGSET